MDDPRRILEHAAEAGVRLEILPRGARWLSSRLVRVERGGVVVLAPGLPVGSDVRCWLTVDQRAWTFEASVIRAGIPVPDRSQGGVLLGFLDGWKPADRAEGPLLLEVVPANGRPLSLLDGDVRLIELGASEWSFTAPASFTLVFVEQGVVRLRMGLPDGPPVELSARVRQLARGDGHLLYAVRVEEAEPRYAELLPRVRARLGL